MIATSNTLAKLIASGVIPAYCTKFEVIAEVQKPVLLRYEVLATEEQMDQLTSALADSVEHGRAVAEQICFVARDPRSQRPRPVVDFSEVDFSEAVVDFTEGGSSITEVGPVSTRRKSTCGGPPRVNCLKLPEPTYETSRIGNDWERENSFK